MRSASRWVVVTKPELATEGVLFVIRGGSVGGAVVGWVSSYRRVRGRMMSISSVSSSSVSLSGISRGGIVGHGVVVLCNCAVIFCDGAVGLEVGRVGW